MKLFHDVLWAAFHPSRHVSYYYLRRQSYYNADINHSIRERICKDGGIFTSCLVINKLINRTLRGASHAFRFYCAETIRISSPFS
jgi:hypothetical protein